MKVIEPGHIYEVEYLDRQPSCRQYSREYWCDRNGPEGFMGHTCGPRKPQRISFVNRESGTEHEGAQTQEILRVMIDMTATLIDRTNHCDNCLRWEGNDRIIKALSEAQRQMNLAILYHEQRVLERRFEKGSLDPAKTPTGSDGHWRNPQPRNEDLID